MTRGTDGSNVEAIQRNIDEYGKTHGDQAEDKATKNDAAAKRFIIESLQIRNGKIRLTGRDTVIDLPPLQMRDVGKSRGGMTGAEIAERRREADDSGHGSSAARALAQDAVKERVDEAKDQAKDRRRPGR